MNDTLPVIAIHGAPRSGTSWLGQIFNSHAEVAYRYQPLFSHAFRGRIGPHSSTAELRTFLADLLASDDPFLHQSGDRALAGYELHFAKQAPRVLAYKEVRFHELLPMLLDRLPCLHLVALVRDPRDVIASWTQAPREFSPEWDIREQWRSGACKNEGHPENWYGFERWVKLATLFTSLAKQHPGRVDIVRYEQLRLDPEAVVGDLFRRCKLQAGKQTMTFLRESQSRDDGHPYGVHRERLTPWTPPGRGIPAGINEAIERELAGTPLARYLRANGE